MWSAAGLRVTGAARLQAGRAGRDPRDSTSATRAATRSSATGATARFEDVTLKARRRVRALGLVLGRARLRQRRLRRTSTSSNGMFTRAAGEPDVDLDSFFWRQVTAPVAARRASRGTPFDDAWRATNRLLAENGVAGAPRAQRAAAQRRARRLRRRLGQRGPRPRPGRPLLRGARLRRGRRRRPRGAGRALVAAAAALPQRLRGPATPRSRCASRGTKSNRDADRRARHRRDRPGCARREVVQAGSGFISQHSKELLFGLGQSTRIAKVEIRWPSGRVQTLRDVPLDRRVVDRGGQGRRAQPSPSAKAARDGACRGSRHDGDAPAAGPRRRPGSTSRSRLPTSRSATSPGRSARSRRWRGRPALAPLLGRRRRRRRVRALAGAGAPARRRFAAAGVSVLAVAVDPPRGRGQGARRRRGAPACRWRSRGEEMAGTVLGPAAATSSTAARTCACPRLLLLDAQRRDREGLPRPGRRRRRSWRTLPTHRRRPGRARLARALPFPGNLLLAPGERNYFQYSLELAEQGYDAAVARRLRAGGEARPERDHASTTSARST